MNNLFAWFVQVTLLIGVGAFLPRLARVHQPRAYLFYCQCVFGVCLLLPFVQPWKRKAFVPPGDAAVSERFAPVSPSVPGAPFDWERVGLAALAAGAILRLGWIGVGLLRLRRYRRASAAVNPLPESVASAQRLTETCAEFRLAGSAEGPVTFGWRNPVVLLPRDFLCLPEQSQLAIACHELLHVRRRDWLYLLVEETASAALWFHPAVWWLLSRIRLSREQAVDQEAVAALGGREPYVDCLLQMAGAPPRLDLAPAPLFLRRRHLSQRIGSLLQEVTVSKARLASTYAFAVAAAAAVIKVSIVFFPLVGQAQVADDAPGVRVETGGKLIYRTPVQYPVRAGMRGVEGTVSLELTLAEDGTVSDARVLTGPEELRKAALASVLEWHYDAAEAQKRAVVTIDFRVPARSAMGPAPGPQPVLVRLNLDAMPPDLRESLRIRLAPFVGMQLTPQISREVHAILTGVRAGMVEWRNDGAGNVTLSVGPERATVPVQTSDFPPAADGSKRVRVGGNLQATKLTHQTPPEYPALAKQARIQGTVRFAVLIAKTGEVKGIQLVAGHPLLVEAAQKAVQQWRYAPTHLNGEPVEVVTAVDVNFTLSQ